MYILRFQAQIKPRHSVTRHYSSCFILHRETSFKKSLRRNCKCVRIAHRPARLTKEPYRHNRNWRFHKDIRLWLTKESGTAPSQKASTFERGVYTFFDPETWERVKKETVIMYDLLEEKAPLTVAGPIGGAPGPQGAPTPQSLPPPGMGLLGQGHQLGQQAQGSHLGQSQPQHPNAQHQQQQQQLHQQQQQQQLADQIRMQSMNARYSGARTPGLGGI